MFNTTKDRRVVEITIEFNVDAIIDWLNSGGKSEDIDKIKREEYGSWGNDVTQKYLIDMLPIGNISNAYYHRNKGVISQNISGIDYLRNVDDETKFRFKKAEVESLEWSTWNGQLLLMIRTAKGKKIIAASPSLIEAIELERKGKLSNGGNLRNEDEEIRVAISLNQDGSPKEFMKMWRGSPSSQSVGYGNALGHISFSILNFEVEY